MAVLGAHLDTLVIFNLVHLFVSVALAIIVVWVHF